LDVSVRGGGGGGGGGARGGPIPTSQVEYHLYAIIMHESAPVDDINNNDMASKAATEHPIGASYDVSSSLLPRGLRRWAKSAAAPVYARDRGHYYCYARDSAGLVRRGCSSQTPASAEEGDPPWYRYDDGVVSPASVDQIIALGGNTQLAGGSLATPYIFAYRRVC
jgi:hypothetical protein